MQDKEVRDNYYFFAHYVMRDIFFLFPPEFMKVPSPLPEMLFKFVWADTEGLVDSPDEPLVPYDEVEVKSFEFGQSYLLLIQLPKPRAITEAYYLGGLVVENGSEDTKYFYTLEYHEKGKACFCQWTEDTHRLWGFTEDISEANFISMIKEMHKLN